MKLLFTDETHQIWQWKYIQKTVHENVRLLFNPERRHPAEVIHSIFSKVIKFCIFFTIFFMFGPSAPSTYKPPASSLFF
jgi:hypothetical protein